MPSGIWRILLFCPLFNVSRSNMMSTGWTETAQISLAPSCEVFRSHPKMGEIAFLSQSNLCHFLSAKKRTSFSCQNISTLCKKFSERHLLPDFCSTICKTCTAQGRGGSILLGSGKSNSSVISWRSLARRTNVSPSYSSRFFKHRIFI